MCAQLCSLMKAQLLKTYEEVVFRFGGHFDMSLMQDCQVRNYFDPLAILQFYQNTFSSINIEVHLLLMQLMLSWQEEERVTLDEGRVVLDEERMLAEWAQMHSDNKENIPMFEDIVNENTPTPNANSVEPVSFRARVKVIA